MSKVRSRRVSLVCYEQPTEQQLSSAIRWAYILHDKDVAMESDGLVKLDEETGEPLLKKPHYHVYMEFGNPRYLSAVANEFHLPEAAINKVSNTKATLAYLTHRTKKAMEQGKFLYDPLEVVQSDDFEFDFTQVVDGSESVDWFTIFSKPTVMEAMDEYKAQGQSMDSLQQFKNFVSTFRDIKDLQANGYYS